MPTPPYIRSAYDGLSQYYYSLAASNRAHPDDKPYVMQMAASAKAVGNHLGIVFERFIILKR